MSKCIHAWTAISVIAVISHFSSGAWPVLLILAVICFGLMKLMPDHYEILQYNKRFCILQLIGIYLLISQLIPFSANYWPGKKAETVVPLTLTVLAIFGTKKRPERVAGILSWITVLLAIPIALAASKTLRMEWIRPSGFSINVWVIPGLLLPMLVCLATGVKRKDKWIRWSYAVGIGSWILVTGVLSYEVAGNSETPFREMGYALSIGQYSRFEAVVSIVITMAWYGFASIMLYCADLFWSYLESNPGKIQWIHGIVLLTLFGFRVRIPPAIMVGYIVYVWLFLPVFELKKISKKSEKSP